MADIGKPIRKIVIVPLRTPVRAPEPSVPAPPQPVKPEKVPA